MKERRRDVMKEKKWKEKHERIKRKVEKER